jgi:outer membrane protein insertion porin family
VSYFLSTFLGDSWTGGAQSLSLTYRPGDVSSDLTLSWSNPFLFNQRLSGGWAIEQSSRDFDSYTLEQSSFRFSLGKSWRNGFSYSVGFANALFNYTGVGDTAPVEVKALSGATRIIGVTPSLTWDTRDNDRIPTQGMKFTASYEYDGDPFPGDVALTRTSISISKFVSIAEFTQVDFVTLRFTAETQRVYSRDSGAPIPFFKLFHAGGLGTVRGYRFRGIGPKDTNGEALGGKVIANATIELSYPLNQNLQFITFVDAAQLGEKYNDLKSDLFSSSYGFGFRIWIPGAGIPIAIDFGYPINKQPGDSTEVFTFTLGLLF